MIWWDLLALFVILVVAIVPRILLAQDDEEDAEEWDSTGVTYDANE